MYKIGDNIRIKQDYREHFGLCPHYGTIESIEGSWITMDTFMGKLKCGIECIQHNIYK